MQKHKIKTEAFVLKAENINIHI